jgi:hypothetical protein
MLGDLGDDMIALFPMREEGPLDSQVVRFAAAACEDDFRGTCPSNSAT